MQGNQDAMSNAASSSRDAAIAAYKAKMDALRGSADLGGDIHSSEMATSARNTDILNSFNQRATSAYQKYLAEKAAMENEAQMKNLDVAQDVSNKNTTTANEFSVNERDRQDDLLKYQTDLESENLDRDNDNKKWGYEQETGERDRIDDIKQQVFDNDLSITQGKTGVTKDGMAQTTQNTQDVNQSIQGLGDSATSVILEQDRRDREDEREKRRREGGY
jgi:hypothetical protein